MDPLEMDISMIGNSISGSPGSNITHNVYTKSHTGGLRKWLLVTGQRAQSKRSALPPSQEISNLSKSILQSSNFEDCVKQKGSTLVFEGSMGSGKSTTMCCLIQDLESRGNVSVASILFDIESPHEQAVCKVLMRFVRQLADLTDEEHYKIVLNMYEKHPDCCPPAWQTADGLVAIIKRAARKQEKTCGKATCIVLDGLDEFWDQSELQQLLTHLQSIQAQSQCGIVMSSRLNIVSITGIFGNCPREEIVAQATDVRNFIKTSTMSHNVRRLLERSPRLWDGVHSAVMSGSHGLFSMVELNTSFILSAPTEENFHRAIEEVCATTPPLRDGNENTLESTGFRTVFERQIQRLFQNTHTSSDRRRVQNSRDIIAFTRDANRKLRINELLHLLALRSSTGEFSDTALEDPQDLLLITQGLIKIDTNDLVHFVHPWLQLYLQNDAAFPDAHQRLAELCIKYLRWPRFSHGPCDSMADIRKIISRAPFWVYAIENLHKHYTSACQRKDQAQLRRSIQAFLRHQSAVTCAQQLIRFVGEEVVDRQHVAELVRETSGDVHPAFVGDNSIAKWLDDHDLYWCSSETTTSLHLAILLQLDTFALELLDATGSILLNATNGLGETPLHLAVVHSCEALVDRLVLHTRDLNACDRRGMSPWHVAAACGSSTAVIALRRSAGRLDFNARVQPIEHRRSAKTTRPSRISPRISSTWNDRELSGSTALHLAARNGHLEIVKQITADTRCDSTIEDDDGMTPFHKACKYGRLEIVEHLIAQGWCPEQQSRKDGRTGLHLACKYKSGFEVARFILQSHPGLCNVKDINHETALHHAAAGLDSRAVRLLLSHPSIDVNPRNLKGQTPVVLAAFTPNDGFEMFTEHEALDRTVRIRSSSLAELAQKWTTIADNRLTADNQTISSGSRLHYRRNARLEYLAKDLSEHGPRLATPEVRTASWTSLSTV